MTLELGLDIAVKSSDPVVVERVRSQTGHILTSHIAHIQILIAVVRKCTKVLLVETSNR